MYERFTDRSRKVMQLANQEAQRFNHEYVGTEHILLGLIKEASGIACKILEMRDIDLRKVRLEVEKLVQSGPEMVPMGKLPQTPRAKKVIEFSMEEARNLNHNYVGTEHILLGLLREQEGIACQVLMNLGLTKIDTLRREILELLGEPKRRFTLTEQRLKEWEVQKEDAVANQDFERAARLREQINKEKARTGQAWKPKVAAVATFNSENFETIEELQQEMAKFLTVLGPENVISVVLDTTMPDHIYEVWHWK